jgi:hypothetical protein
MAKARLLPDAPAPLASSDRTNAAATASGEGDTLRATAMTWHVAGTGVAGVDPHSATNGLVCALPPCRPKGQVSEMTMMTKPLFLLSQCNVDRSVTPERT